MYLPVFVHIEGEILFHTRLYIPSHAQTEGQTHLGQMKPAPQAGTNTHHQSHICFDIEISRGKRSKAVHDRLVVDLHLAK